MKRVETRFEMLGMALRPEHLQAWIDKNGPYAYHDTYPWNVESVLREGIVPGKGDPSDSERGREGFVYLYFTEGQEPAIGATHTFRVDLRKLDPSLFSADEDFIVPDVSDNRFWDQFTHDKPFADWAEQRAELLDDPKTTNESLVLSERLAYRGTIPPDAIEYLGVGTPSGYLK